MSWYGVTDSGWFYNHRYQIAVAGWPARLTSWGKIPYDPKDERDRGAFTGVAPLGADVLRAQERIVAMRHDWLAYGLSPYFDESWRAEPVERKLREMEAERVDAAIRSLPRDYQNLIEAGV